MRHWTLSEGTVLRRGVQKKFLVVNLRHVGSFKADLRLPVAGLYLH